MVPVFFVLAACNQLLGLDEEPRYVGTTAGASGVAGTAGQSGAGDGIGGGANRGGAGDGIGGGADQGGAGGESGTVVSGSSGGSQTGGAGGHAGIGGDGGYPSVGAGADTSGRNDGGATAGASSPATGGATSLAGTAGEGVAGLAGESDGSLARAGDGGRAGGGGAAVNGGDSGSDGLIATGGISGANGGESATTGGVPGEAGGTSDTMGGALGETGGTSDSTGGTTEVAELGGYHIHGDWSGFAFTFATEATITPDPETGFSDMLDADGPYCVRGTVEATEVYTSLAAVGFNTNQEKVEDAEVHTTVSSSTGLMIHVADPGLPSLRVQIEDNTDPYDPDAANHRWCANISEFDEDIVIPWGAFDLTCWDPDDDSDAGVVFDPGTPIARVLIYHPDEGLDGSAQNFDFCVNDIGPADVVSRGTGEIVDSCNNSVSWSTGSLSGTSSTLSTDGKYGMQANGWDDGGGGIGITGNGGGGFHVDSTNCAKTSETDGPCSFPSVFRGERWGDAGTSGDSLPIQVSALSSAPTCLGWSAGSGDGYNISFDVWFSGNSGATTPDKFMMLWFRTPQNWQPAGDFPEGNVVIGDQIWARWYGPNTDGQNVTTYAAPGTLAQGQAYSFDLKDFIDDAVENGHISSSDYLSSVMAGTEIWEGGLGASIDGFRTEPQ